MRLESPAQLFLAQAIAKLLEYIQQRYGIDEEITYALAAAFIRAITELTEQEEGLKACMDDAFSVLKDELAKQNSSQSPNN